MRIDGYVRRVIRAAEQSSNPLKTILISLPTVHKETQFALMLYCLSKQLISLEGLKLTEDILYDSFIIHLSLDNESSYDIKHSAEPPKSQLHLSMSKTVECNRKISTCPELFLDNRIQKGQIIGALLPACSVCKKYKHNYLLHKYTESLQSSAPESPDASTSLDVECSHQVQLSTVVCQLYDSYGQAYMCRALLVCGTQSKLILT
nr:unnamed protein product [Callosobruchus chinensis]